MERETEKQAQNIIETLARFDVPAELKNVVTGPSVTQFDLILCGNGVIVEDAMKCEREIASALGLSCGIRIYRNYKDGVSIEVPNSTQEQISYSAMMNESDNHLNSEALQFTIGKDIEGHWVHGEISSTRLRRLIVGGYGYDKIVFLKAMIAELTERYSPANLRLILLGGHYRELSAFCGLPHLISDVVSDPAHAMGALDWSMFEMERRFSLLSRKTQEGACAYNIEKYNAACKKEEKLPRILIVAEEVNDYLGCGEDRYKINRAFEDRIDHLALRGHAVGIHLILSTEHPMPESFTKVLKRVSYSCIASQMSDDQESCLILGEGGAEKLIGNCDLLYQSGEGWIPQRIQGIDISSKELEQAVVSVKKKFERPSLYADTVF